MTRIAHRELRNSSSEILRRVSGGESFEVTNNGDVVALLVPPPSDRFARLVRSGKITPSQGKIDFGALRRADGLSSREILDDLRGEA